MFVVGLTPLVSFFLSLFCLCVLLFLYYSSVYYCVFLCFPLFCMFFLCLFLCVCFVRFFLLLFCLLLVACVSMFVAEFAGCLSCVRYCWLFFVFFSRCAWFVVGRCGCCSLCGAVCFCYSCVCGLLCALLTFVVCYLGFEVCWLCCAMFNVFRWLWLCVAVRVCCLHIVVFLCVVCCELFVVWC